MTLSNTLTRMDILGGLLHRVNNYDPKTFEVEFDERLVLQKTIYLMQEFGLYIGYNFRWYIRGPYSPELTRDAFAIMQKYDELPVIRFTGAENEKKFENFIQFIAYNKSNEDWLESIASIHFLRKYSHIKDRNTIYNRIKGKMPTLKKKLFDQCWEYLQHSQLWEE